MAEHKFAQVLRWLADGKRVQVNVDGWTTCSDEGVFRHIMNNACNYRKVFRLEPTRIKIGGIEVDPPVRRPIEGGLYYYLCSDVQEPVQTIYRQEDEWSRHAAQCGWLFDSFNACKKAQRAIANLLTQNPEASHE